MKNTRIMILLLVLSASLPAQDIIEKKAALDEITEVGFDLDFAENISVKTWEKNEVSIKALVNINNNEDNEKYHLSLDSSQGKIKVCGEIEDLGEIGRVEKGHKHELLVKGDKKCVDIQIDYQIFLPAGKAFCLETISGNIAIREHPGPMEIQTISGFIDLSLPPGLDADFEMSTITGEMFSDLDLYLKGDKEGLLFLPGNDVEARLNKGGTMFLLETISGNIYLRKE